MIIQHNIMAMNAYRNYKANTSALSANLEKLSSGYKINRAGDDAAGLAISEKMRAQITGLEAAQKNVKDGISLVKTAEGAMQEIQDMLNRMDYLATQSANGTYQDEVDREALQQEVDALREEINRIADSANFNGIKLLDGSLDSSADISASADLTVGGDLPSVGQTLGTDTVLHNDANASTGTQFSVELHNFNFTADPGSTMTMKVGDTTFELTADDAATGTVLTGKDLAAALAGDTSKNTSVKVNGQDYTGGNIKINGQDFSVAADTSSGKLTFTQVKAPSNAAQEVNGSMSVTISGANADVKGEVSVDATALLAEVKAGDTIKIGDIELTLTASDVASDTALATAIAGGTSQTFNAAVDDNDSTKVVLTAKTAGEISAPAVTFSRAADNAASASATKVTTGAAAATATTTDTLTGAVTGTTGTLSINDEDVVEAGDFTAGTAINGTTGDGLYAWTVSATGAVTITAVGDGTDANGDVKVSIDGAAAQTLTFTGGEDAAKAVHTIDLSAWDGSSKLKIGNTEYDDISAVKTAIETAETSYDVTEADGVITLTAKTAGTTADPTAANVTVSYGSAAIADKAIAGIATVTKAGKSGGEIEGITEGSNGDWNVSTTDIDNVTSGGLNRLASTYFDLTEDIASEGSQLRIGDDVYTFTSDKEKLADTNGKYVDISSGDLDKIAKNLTDIAADNKVYTVGHDGSRITVTETTDHAAKYANETYSYDLRTEEGVAKSLGFTAGTNVKGKALNLQIGDSSDSYNQMKIEVGDMHTSAMGTEGGMSIADINVGTSEGAQKAVDVIKDAINYVSSVRGQLGAYQNRLEHTANNLSVMAENITDAESTIRDTDVAEEMMSYVKNNILVQSAQAMLAQANQVPQGVLQLLG